MCIRGLNIEAMLFLEKEVGSAEEISKEVRALSEKTREVITRKFVKHRKEMDWPTWRFVEHVFGRFDKEGNFK